MKTIDKKNDIVLTPDYIADLMCQLSGVNAESVVLDNACGNGSLLKEALKYNPKKVIGIEVEKMMFDQIQRETTNTSKEEYICGDGLDINNIPDDANILLSNPPYSFDGGGLIFDEKALNKIKSGMAVILIKQGAGNNTEYTKNILKNNTLIASIAMPDIFKGFASVDTSIYVIKCGVPHCEDALVKFIDFSNDGYSRSGRKTQKGTVKDTDHAKERYEELISIFKNKKPKTEFYKDKYVEDTIDLNGGGWNYNSHVTIDTRPSTEDMKKVVNDYLEWKCKCLLSEKFGSDYIYTKASLAMGIDPRNIETKNNKNK